MNEIIVRCITETSRGYGNFTRSFTLAQSLYKQGFKITFLINHNKYIINQLKQQKISFVLIPKSISYSKEFFFISKFMNSQRKLLILDMREYGEQISKKLMNKNFNTILIDDAFCKRVYADIFFNGTLIKKYHNYRQVNENSKLYLGSKYFLANKEFLEHKKTISEIKNKKNYHVVISIGGSDPTQLSLFIIKSIMDIPKIKITLIVGPFFKNVKKIRESIIHYDNIKLVYSPKKIWKIFQKADVVISKSGITLYELAIMGIPTICISSFKHEEPNAKVFASKGFLINLGMQKNIKSNDIQNALITILNDKTKRKKMSIIGRKLIDGRGLLRVTKIITEFLHII